MRRLSLAPNTQLPLAATAPVDPGDVTRGCGRALVARDARGLIAGVALDLACAKVK